MTPTAGDPVALAAQLRWQEPTVFTGMSAVGALFVKQHGRISHFCTASVVHSPAGNLLITAAHCLQGRSLTPSGAVFFAPGYYRGHFPYGRWAVRSVLTDSQWQKHQNPADDFAFLVTGRPGARIERHTGAETLDTSAALPKKIQVIGYPDTRNLPLICNTTARLVGPQHPFQEMFTCDGFTDGTSGGPFLTNVKPSTGTGEVIGTIGGYQLGGDTPDISYSSRFLTNIAALYQSAMKL